MQCLQTRATGAIPTCTIRVCTAAIARGYCNPDMNLIKRAPSSFCAPIEHFLRRAKPSIVCLASFPRSCKICCRNAISEITCTCDAVGDDVHVWFAPNIGQSTTLVLPVALSMRCVSAASDSPSGRLWYSNDISTYRVAATRVSAGQGTKVRVFSDNLSGRIVRGQWWRRKCWLE